jgi:hypothetical protein
VDTPARTVFLCGPITGLTRERAAGWRAQVTRALAGEAVTLDPMRDQPDVTRRAPGADTDPSGVGRLVHGKRTVARNRFDVERSDLVLACFLGATSVSIGAVGEIFWADLLRKPVIIVREADNPHNHDMLNEIAAWIFADLDLAIAQVRRMLCPSSVAGDR